MPNYNNPSWRHMTKCVEAEILLGLSSKWATQLVFGGPLPLEQRIENMDAK